MGDGRGVDKVGPRVQAFPKEVVNHEGVARREGGGRSEAGRVWQERETGRTHHVSIMFVKGIGMGIVYI